MKKIIVFLICVFFVMAGCSNPETKFTFAGNASENPTIPIVGIGQLYDEDMASIAMSLGVFGVSEQDIEITEVYVYINGVLGRVVKKPIDFFRPDTQLVVFVLSPLETDDELDFVITKYGFQAARYTGKVSNEEDTFAELVIFDEEDEEEFVLEPVEEE